MFLGHLFDEDGVFLSPNASALKFEFSLPSLDTKLRGLSNKLDNRLFRTFCSIAHHASSSSSCEIDWRKHGRSGVRGASVALDGSSCVSSTFSQLSSVVGATRTSGGVRTGSVFDSSSWGLCLVRGRRALVVRMAVTTTINQLAIVSERAPHRRMAEVSPEEGQQPAWPISSGTVHAGDRPGYTVLL